MPFLTQIRVTRAREVVLLYARVAVSLCRISVYDRVKLHAQALTYDTLLAIVPLMAVMLAVYKGFGGMEQMSERLQSLLVSHLAGSPDIQVALLGYLQNFANAQIGLLSVGILVISVIGLLSHIDTAFNTIFAAPRLRPFVTRVLTYWAILTFGPIVLGATLALTAWFETANVRGVLGGLGPIQAIAIQLSPLILTWLAFGALYLFLPNTRVPLLPATVAAVVAGSAWNAAKWGYAWYATHAITMQNIYGSLAAVPLFILWIYFSWLLVLFGGQLTYALAHAGADGEATESILLSQESREQLAVGLLSLLASTLVNRRSPLGVEELAQRLRISAALAEETLAAVHRGGFVERTEAHTVVLTADIDHCTVGMVVAHLRAREGTTLGAPVEVIRTAQSAIAHDPQATLRQLAAESTQLIAVLGG